MAPPFLTPFRMSNFEFRVGLLSGLQYFGDTPVLWCVDQFPAMDRTGTPRAKATTPSPIVVSGGFQPPPPTPPKQKAEPKTPRSRTPTNEMGSPTTMEEEGKPPPPTPPTSKTEGDTKVEITSDFAGETTPRQDEDSTLALASRWLQCERMEPSVSLKTTDEEDYAHPTWTTEHK